MQTNYREAKKLMRKLCTAFAFFAFATSCAMLPNSYYKGKSSDHFDGSRFIPNGEESTFGHLIFALTPKNNWKNEKEKIEQHNLNKPVNKARITFVGHASFLVQVPNANILIDPMWSDRAGPIALPFVSIKRQNPPSIAFEELPKIDYVLISYNSYYHMDIPTIKKLKEKFNPKFITGLGNCHYLNDVKKLNLLCVELDWNQKATPQNDLDFYFLKSQNWAKRSWIDKNKTLWGSFAINASNFKIYFSGDTGYSNHFKEIQDKFENFDVALLAIGSFEPRWLMEKNHMNPEDAVKAHITLGSKKSIGFHFSTFQTSDEGYLAPKIALEKAREKYGLNKEDFVAPSFGEAFEF
jgi:L-ascorbate metabolism protein UlaG (beta-lactamase superfamily)